VHGRECDGIADDFESKAPVDSIAGAASMTSFSRRELFLWLASILFATTITQALMRGSASLESLIRDFAGISGFQALGWFAVLRLLTLERSTALITKQDIWATGILGAIILMPAGRALWIAATLLAAFIYLRSQKGSDGRAGATVLGALCVQSLWGPALFSFFSIEILRADAALVGTALDATQNGFIWHDNVIATQDHSVEIYNGCSSFHNVSLAALCWITLTKLNRPTFIKSDFLFGTAACVAMIALNATRLYLMALSPDNLVYWHDGLGAQIFAVGSTLILATICLWGTSVGDTRHE
jgi:hypothetical protein